MNTEPYFEIEDTLEQDNHGLWCERYRPRKLDEFLGSESVKETIKIFLEKQEIPHLLFYGPPGTGKTSIAKILIKSISCDSVMVNASDENRIDDIRYKVQDFAMTMGIHPLKIMVLDECLDENTLVWILRDGIEQSVIIKELDQSSDLVRSFNIEKNRIEWRPFYLISQGIKETYELEFENGEIVVCTDTHKWYVKDETGNIIKVKTSDIVFGKYTYILTTEENRLISDFIHELKIKSIKKFTPKIVYDLSVNGNYNFFIGSTKILTSNCDRLTVDAMSVMRNLMETYSTHTRFILTANYHEKILPALRSRCQCFEIKPPSKKDCAGLLAKILTTEKVKFEPQDVVFIVNSYFSDMRKIINFAQQSNVRGALKIAKENAVDMDYKLKLIRLLKTPTKGEVFTEIRQLIADASFSNYEEVYKFLYDRVSDYAPGKEAAVILELADASYQSALVFEREITFCAAMHKLLKVLVK